MIINAPISVGELYDKISILEIKLAHINSDNIKKEYKLLKIISKEHPICVSLYEQLKNLNQDLWNIEDKIRECELNKDFSEEFINLARSVYMTNDLRSDLKKYINIRTGSEIFEEKLYKKYL